MACHFKILINKLLLFIEVACECLGHWTVTLIQHFLVVHAELFRREFGTGTIPGRWHEMIVCLLIGWNGLKAWKNAAVYWEWSTVKQNEHVDVLCRLRRILNVLDLWIFYAILWMDYILWVAFLMTAPYLPSFRGEVTLTEIEQISNSCKIVPMHHSHFSDRVSSPVNSNIAWNPAENMLVSR